MRVWKDSDEWYPVYSLRKKQPQWATNDVDHSIVVPDKLWYRYKAALKEFNKVQDIIRDLEPLP